MARAHRYEMLPHVHALLTLVEQADEPDLLFREVVALLVHEAPIIVEAHVIRSADHVEGVTRLGAALMGHLAAGRGSMLQGMRRTVLEAAKAHLDELDEYLRVVSDGGAEGQLQFHLVEFDGTNTVSSRPLGSVVGFRRQGAYGQEFTSGGEPELRRSFHGHREEPGLALTAAGPRHLLRADGRWLQPEPLLYLEIPEELRSDPRALMMYRYGHNAPSVYADPSGMSPSPVDQAPAHSFETLVKAMDKELPDQTHFDGVADAKQHKRVMWNLAKRETANHAAEMGVEATFGAVSLTGPGRRPVGWIASNAPTWARNSRWVSSWFGAPPGTLTASEVAEIRGISKQFDTTIDVVGSRAAGQGRNIETSLPVGKDLPGAPGTTRSDIDFRVDGTHARVDDLCAACKAVGGGAGSAKPIHSNSPATGGRETFRPFIRFRPDGSVEHVK